MIDKLRLRIPFKPECLPIDFRKLGIPYQCEIEGGEVTRRFQRPETIPSSFSGVALYIVDGSSTELPGVDPFAYLEVLGSPAYVMQGHNVFGSDNLGDCALALLDVVVNKYPHLLDLVNYAETEVAEVDITYSSKAETQQLAEQAILYLRNISKGHTKASAASRGYTAYFGSPRSKYKRIKVYLKAYEIAKKYTELKRKRVNEKVLQLYEEKLFSYAETLIRWELTLKHRWFSRRDLPINLVELNKVWNPYEYFSEGTKDLFAALEGEDMRATDDKQIHDRLRAQYSGITRGGNVTYRQADECFGFYKLVESIGLEKARKLKSERTGYRFMKMLESVGVSRAMLCNMEEGATVVPLIRFTEINISEQVPEWASDYVIKAA